MKRQGWSGVREVIALVSILLAGCSPSGQEARAPLPFDPAYLRNTEGVTVLSWDDLMPEGEEAELARQQRAFYQSLDKKLAITALRPKTLSEAGAAGGYDAIEEGSELDFMPQLGTYNVVEDLDNARVRIPGFIVPLEMNDFQQYTTFLLVPYFGACIHFPPPPPNQIIYVTTELPLKLVQPNAPYFIEGLLRAERQENDLGNTAYALTLDTVMFYED